MRRWRIPTWLKAGTLPVLVATAASAAVLLIPAATETAVANGDTRTIHLLHAHTHESIDATYMVDGQYDPAVLEKLNWFLRDFRRDEATHMDPKLFDVIWEVYREAGSHQPIEVMSAYRSPETNAMLRRASRGVAEHSQHILGKAMDQHYMDVPMSRIREIAMRLQRGGVGFYPTAGTPFVHMDVGGVRHWPRMSYDQLARLFPDGKTVHIPSNGQPLPGYEVARAELEARGDSFDYPTAGEVQSKSKGFFAWLFGGGDDEGDEAEGTRAAPASRRAVASIDRAPVGTTDGAPFGLSSHNDDGAHGFMLSEAQTRAADPAPAPSPQPAPAKGRRGRTQVASLPAVAPPSAEAQQKLADEMQRQQTAAELQRKAAADAQAAAASEAAATQARADADARPAAAPAPSVTAFDPTGNADLPLPAAAAPSKIAAPLPPRRPVEFASTGPAAPIPPARPGALASDHAPTLRPTAVASLSPVPPSARPDLPSVITRGAAPLPPRVLGFAAAPAAAVPLPVARPQLVAARLDRSNFRSLTEAGPGKGVGRGGLGSAMSGLRPAARASLGTIANAPSTGAARGFGQRATDLTTDRFSGTAQKSSERISTAVLRKPRADTTSD